MTAPKIELLPCPFCGQPAKMRVTLVKNFEPHCSDVLCLGFISLNPIRIDNPQDAATAWNTRAPIKPSGEVRLSLTVGEDRQNRLLSLEHLYRTVDAWLSAEDAYQSAQGENIPYTIEYASIVESRIFNNHALREAIKNLRSQTKDANQSLPTQGIKE